jgi:hypothetical protein
MTDTPKTAEEMARAALVHAHNEGRNLTSQEVFALVESAMAAGKAEAETQPWKLAQTWRDGYYTGKRDYAGSVMGGMPIRTPNPYEEASMTVDSDPTGDQHRDLIGFLRDNATELGITSDTGIEKSHEQ